MQYIVFTLCSPSHRDWLRGMNFVVVCFGVFMVLPPQG